MIEVPPGTDVGSWVRRFQGSRTPERLADMFPGTLKHHLVPLETSGQYFNYDPLV